MLDSHIKNVHQNLYSNICDICAVMFKSKYSVEQHKVDVHGINAVPKVQCDKCGAWYINITICDNFYIFLNPYFVLG